MQSLLNREDTDAILARIAALAADARPLWGGMDTGQMLAHCALGLECATGRSKPPRMLLGRLLGWIARPGFVGPKPFAKNGPTGPGMKVADPRDVEHERSRLEELVRAFQRGGEAGCTTHPHTFFGVLTPAEWGRAMYKHLDHHLRQFGA